jgi:HD-GYP domain-containing protein (c-di-GMP phosphodiesterase class II)
MAAELLRLVASQVKVGAPLPFGVRDEGGKLLLARGQVVGSDAQLAALLSRGLYADVDEVKASRDARAAEADRRQPTLFDLWEQAVGRLDRLLKGIDEPGFGARCDEFAVQFIALIQRDPDIGIYLSVRQDMRRMHLYGLAHALHCALLCQLVAVRIGWPEPRARTLVKAALTMNIAISEIQGRIAVMGRLSDSQRDLIRNHPAQGVQRLRAAGIGDEEWLRAVVEHHECPGGGGYPNGLNEICEAASILRMADIFMAKISPRAERAALSIQDVAREMFNESHGSPAASAIIKEYGIYPPGNFVKLASGEQAVVIRRGATAHTPMAAAITDKSGVPMVRTLRRDTAQPAFAIKALLPPSELLQRLPPERLYGLVE